MNEELAEERLAYWSWLRREDIPKLGDDTLIKSIHYATARHRDKLEIQFMMVEAYKRPKLVVQLVSMILKGLL